MPTAFAADFHQLHVAVVHPRDHDGDVLMRHLQRLGCQTALHWPPAAALGAEFDVLFCLIDPEARPVLDAATMAGTPAIIGILDQRQPRSLRLLQEATPHAVIQRPIDPAAVVPNLVVARHNARYQRRLLSKVTKLEETLRSYRKVERAKIILMEQRKIGEPEAYSYLREQAMRRRMPIGAVASIVVDSNEILPADKG
ncbi:MAG TPA: ANTAR domain-containing protein [Stellaceae bacterium]|nr:ANTAR domain-containing protein [Stellaceae bacterium]